MKRTLFIVGIGMLVAFLCVSLIGCASTSATWKNDDSGFRKGQLEKSVRDQLGKPYKSSTDSDGNKVLQYAKPAEGREAVNTMCCICSFGMGCGANSCFVDKLKFYVKDGRVVKTEQEENVLSLF